MAITPAKNRYMGTLVNKGKLVLRSLLYSDVLLRAMAFQITGVSLVYSTVCSGANQRKHQSSASLAFVRGIHRWPVNSSHKWSVTRKCFHLMTSSWYNSFEDPVPVNCIEFIDIDFDFHMEFNALITTVDYLDKNPWVGCPVVCPVISQSLEGTMFEFRVFNRFEIWHVSRPHYCRDTCQILKRYVYTDTKSCGSELISSIRCIFGCWNVPLVGPSLCYTDRCVICVNGGVVCRISHETFSLITLSKCNLCKWWSCM